MQTNPPPQGHGSTGPRSSGGPSVPHGITTIVVLGFIGAFLSFLGALELFGEGHDVLGIVVLLLTVGQAAVLLGLLGLQSWAWTFGVVFYCLGGLFGLVRVDILGVLISVSIVGYLLSARDKFD